MTVSTESTSRAHPVVSVLGVHISALSMRQAVDTIVEWTADRSSRAYVTVTGVHGVMESQRAPELLDIHNAADMTTPDGMPMVWASRRAGIPTVERVYGPDLVQELAREGGERGWSIYCLGGAPGVAADFGHTLCAANRGLRLAGAHCPPFSDEVVSLEQSVIEDINASGAALLFVGLSTPKQERWMALHRPLLNVPVIVGVGAAFDLLTGRIRQAPAALQRMGIEWLFRLAMEPRRLFWRYLRNNPAFLVRAVVTPPRIVHSGEMHGGGE